MDSEERHELKENDLAEFFRNFGEWWSQYGNYVLIVVILLAAGITGYNFYHSRVTQRHEQAWTDLAVATSPEGFAQVAEAHDDPVVQALAQLRAADLYRRRAIGRYEPIEQPDVTLDEQGTLDGLEGETEAQADPAEDLAQAAALYQRVLEQDAQRVPTVYRVNALLGLGAVLESEKNWDDAREQYDRAAELAGEALPQLAAQARQRRELLDELRRPIAFAPESDAPDTGATGPANVPGLPAGVAPAPGAGAGEAPDLEIDVPDAPESDPDTDTDANTTTDTGADDGAAETP
ncbi:MAG: tetratricopeptide repeat protein [Phycisphaeraceae bacterium]